MIQQSCSARGALDVGDTQTHSITHHALASSAEVSRCDGVMGGYITSEAAPTAENPTDSEWRSLGVEASGRGVRAVWNGCDDWLGARERDSAVFSLSPLTLRLCWACTGLWTDGRQAGGVMSMVNADWTFPAQPASDTQHTTQRSSDCATLPPPITPPPSASRAAAARPGGSDHSSAWRAWLSPESPPSPPPSLPSPSVFPLS